MGLLEGNTLGHLEGFDEGSIVSIVGRNDGFTEGQEGAKVGCREGLLDGVDGTKDGLVDGTNEGYNEGSDDGYVDGTNDGTIDGTSDDSMVGKDVWLTDLTKTKTKQLRYKNENIFFLMISHCSCDDYDTKDIIWNVQINRIERPYKCQMDKIKINEVRFSDSDSKKRSNLCLVLLFLNSPNPSPWVS